MRLRYNESAKLIWTSMPCHGVYPALANGNRNISRPKDKFLLTNITSLITLRFIWYILKAFSLSKKSNKIYVFYLSTSLYDVWLLKCNHKISLLYIHISSMLAERLGLRFSHFLLCLMSQLPTSFHLHRHTMIIIINVIIMVAPVGIWLFLLKMRSIFYH